jgi:Family of unknown function (DUF5985)
MATLIYCLCAVTSALCASLLWQAYRRTTYRLLLWSSLFFSVSTFNNLLLMVDKLIFPVEIDLSIPRYLVALTALGFLFRGLIFDEEESR